MTKLTELQTRVHAFIKKNPKISHTDLLKQVGIPPVHLANALKALSGAKLLTVELKGEVQHYTVVEPPKADENAVEQKDGKTAKDGNKSEAPTKKTSGKKDFSTFKFQGKDFRKGRLPLAIIAAWCEEHEPTLAQLEAAWPSKEIRPYGYGLFRIASEAKKINEQSGRIRFFTKPEELVKIKGQTIAVTNQITGELLSRFLIVAKKHKLTVK